MSVILIADDNPHAHRMGKQILSQEGYDVATASDGHEAMSYLRENRPDLVMADTRMPGPSGFEICEYVKSAESLKGVRVVLLAGPLEPFDPAHAERVGSDAVLHKPLDAYTLIETVKSLIGASVDDEEPPTEAEPDAGADEAEVEFSPDETVVDADFSAVARSEESPIDIPDPDDFPTETELADSDVIDLPAEEKVTAEADETAATSSDDPLADLVDMALGSGPAESSDSNRHQVQQAVRDALEDALPALVETIADRVVERLEEK